MTTYIDTALFVKSYVLEVDSPETVRLLEEMGEPFAYSHPHELEIPNAIRLKLFRGEITAAEETAAIRAFLPTWTQVASSGSITILATSSFRAEKLSAKHSGEIGCRSLDLWHVAAAL
jgi:hypothetical protein